MFYNIVSGKIGLKKLTNADLGSQTSHQTHIGLYEGTLSHLPYERKTYSSQLIYNGQAFEGYLFLKFINNNRSPAINVGTIQEQRALPNNLVSVGKQIREIANTNRSLNWFLVWFALDNDEIISFIFNQVSSEYQQLNSISNLLDQMGERGLKIGEDDSRYPRIASLLNSLTTNANIEYIEELEIVSQVGAESLTKKIIPRVRDIEKANVLFKQTGEKGEGLLFQYLENQKSTSQIKDFKWLNQSKETGMPYDFEITTLDNTIFFSDAKATNYKFSQPMILSTGELKFINENKENYLIHRLYSISDVPKLRVCNNIFSVSDLFIPPYQVFNNSITASGLKLQGAKLAVTPSLEILNFGEEILL